MPEAPLRESEGGLVPDGDGWFVVNAREAAWQTGHFGAYTRFDGEPRFGQVGVNIAVLEPGQPSCLYHGEGDQAARAVARAEVLRNTVLLSRRARVA